MLSTDVRRNRCQLMGCGHARAVVRIGKKADGFYICKRHLLELQKELKGFKFEEPVVEEVVDETPRVEVIADAPVDEHPNFEEGGDGVFVCKHCGKEFPKSEYTVSQFATHSRLCKKEHEAK